MGPFQHPPLHQRAPEHSEEEVAKSGLGLTFLTLHLGSFFASDIPFYP